MFRLFLKLKAALFTLILAAMFPSLSFAEAIDIDGIFYNLDKESATASVCTKTTNLNGNIYDTDYYNFIEIPETVSYVNKTYTVTTILGWTFSYCRSLCSVSIPESVDSIGDGAFFECLALTEVNIPEAMTSIGNSTFSWCMALKSIHIPESVTSIGDYVFNGCMALKSIHIPESVTSIGNSAFYKCTSLTSIDIPKSVTSIGDRVFGNCKSMKTISLPAALTSIGDSVFVNCPELTSVKCLNPVPVQFDDEYAMTEEPIDTLYVPDEAVEAYRASKWSKWFNEIVGVEMQYPQFFAADEDPFEILYGTSKTLTINFDATTSPIGFQADVTLPEGLEIVMTDGKYDIEFASNVTKASHTLAAAKVGDGNTYRIVAFSTTNAEIADGENQLNFNIEAVGSSDGGQIVFNNVVVSLAGGTGFKADELTINAVIINKLYGDANNNGVVTIDDVMAEVQYILDQDPQPFNFELADVNQDEEINIIDVTGTVDIILSSEYSAPNFANALNGANQASGNMMAEDVLLDENHNGTLVLQLSSGDVTGMQADIVLPQGVSVTNVKMAAEQNSDHIVSFANVGDNHIRFVAYSLSMASVQNDMPLIKIELQGTEDFTEGYAQVFDAYSSDSDCALTINDCAPVKISNGTTGIKSVNNDTTAEIYNINGTLVKRSASNSDINALTPGIYIIGGKKTLVK